MMTHQRQKEGAEAATAVQTKDTCLKRGKVGHEGGGGTQMRASLGKPIDPRFPS